MAEQGTPVAASRAALAGVGQPIRRRPLPPVLPLFGAGMPAVLQRVYAARQVSDAQALERGLDGLHRHTALSGMTAAVDILEAALTQAEPVLIVGDYDADGATSTALMVLGLRALGAARVDYLVPNRFEFGYGLSPAIVAVAARQAPRVLVTVDNGISSVAGVAAARAAGMQVVVTDHHLPGAELPEADAIVNPNLPGDAFPSKSLAGVGVAFYLLVALRARLREGGRLGATPPNLADLLDLVALGTVADVVALDRNNRILVHQGLARIRAGRCRPGITALLAVAGRDPRCVVAGDLGFAVGPRLNAAGRLTDMTLGIECLLGAADARTRDMAVELDRLNGERRRIEADMGADASAYVAGLELDGALPAALSLFEPHWHAGVVGIVASRVKDRVRRPVIAFAPDGDAVLKGSARSVAGLHVKDALERVAALQPGLIKRFGGHAMAAGLSIASADLESFRRVFAEVVAAQLGADGIEAVWWTDGELSDTDLDLPLAELLRDAGPWGPQFPEPQFDGVFRVLDQRVVGERHLKLLLGSPGSARRVEAIAFNQAHRHPCAELQRLVYRLDVNEFRGTRRAQLLVEYMEPA